ncbi:30S ribosomal protein S13 [Candidatus Micrarchaeota archaeon CG_4_10_14_0_2_um_filter_55_9]|nr:MAG: 30S ribosomal protein S13 [Candidatus Micrarchaeota archaeon CG09_land_8_20_14_0_10_55_25]PIZ92167.1 MAG: 30S ribosomal protein S13 [Candidatus Micrarchaeota archaeon CG_4_10_14_0_2_um_filter_55_9]
MSFSFSKENLGKERKLAKISVPALKRVGGMAVKKSDEGDVIKKAAPKPERTPDKAGKDYKGIVRIFGQDVKGSDPLKRGLQRVKGIGSNLAASLTRAIERESSINGNELCGNLSDQQIEEIEEILKNPVKHEVKPFVLNRLADPEKGSARHVLGTDLRFATRQDIMEMRETRSWKGFRHATGQKVRGQHTRTTGRSGMSVGVLKKAAKQQKGAAAQKAQETGKK